MAVHFPRIHSHTPAETYRKKLSKFIQTQKTRFNSSPFSPVLFNPRQKLLSLPLHLPSLQLFHHHLLIFRVSYRKTNRQKNRRRRWRNGSGLGQKSAAIVVHWVRKYFAMHVGSGLNPVGFNQNIDQQVVRLFPTGLHSNSHRKVLDMRQKKEIEPPVQCF